MSEFQSETTQDNSAALRNLILSVRGITRLLLRRWWVLLIFCAVVTGLMWLNAYVLTPVTYTSKLTFMLNDEGSKSSGVSGLLGVLGGAAANSYSLDKVIELSKSRKVMAEAMFEIAEVDGKSDCYANHFIDVEEFDKVWKSKNPELAGFRFKRFVPDSFDRKENKVMLQVYSKIIGNKEEGIEGYFNAKYGETSGIVSFNVKTQSEELSNKFLEELYGRLRKFYTSQTNDKAAQNYRLLLSRRDSIERVLKSKDYVSAGIKDQSNGLVFSTSAVPGQQVDRDRRVLELMFAEATKNVEIADYTLRTISPFLVSIDMPIAPIKPGIPSPIKTTIIGIILGFILGSLWVIGRAMVREAMK
jgi:hypothetical protein